MPILTEIVPDQVDDSCIDAAPLNCGNEISSNNTESEFNIEFPRGISTLPLAGGAVVSIKADDLKLKSSANVANIVKRNLNSLSGLELSPKLDDLSKSRVAVNNALFDIARRNLKVVNEGSDTERRKRAPFVYLSVYKGEDASALVDGISNPDMIRVCEFRYIPSETFIGVLENLLDSSKSFDEIIGVSGRTYGELELAAFELTAIGGDIADIVDLVLEFFPIVNMSETALSSVVSEPIIGGYYTILDGTIYMKMPDLSGRDSAGSPGGLLNSSSSLWFEVQSGPAITRSEINDFKFPPIASFSGEQPTEFPGDALDITFELSEDESVDVYLSPIVKNLSVKNQRALNVFSDQIELFSVPVLTRPIQDGAGRLAMISEETSPSTKSINPVLVNTYYPGFSESDSASDPAKNGYPYIEDQDAHVFFGEKNRPEMILSDNGDSEVKNNKRYYNLSTYGVLNILSSIMPKIYNGVPDDWAMSKPSKDTGGTYTATFPISAFKDINLTDSAHNGSIEYAVYVKDSVGQVTRVSGPAVSLFYPTPAIEVITPDGFNGGKRIILENTEVINLIIKGTDLSEVQKVRFTAVLSGIEIILPLTDSIVAQPTNESMTLTFNVGDFTDRGFISGEYTVVLEGAGSELLSEEDSVYLAIDEDQDLPSKEEPLARFDSDEFNSTSFGDKPVIGIPLFKNGTSASIGIRSKGKVLSTKRDVYAYLAFPDEHSDKLSEFSLSEDIIKVATTSGSLLVPIGVEYKLEKATTADFFKSKFSNKKATLNFPGKDYAAYNFSSLVGIDKAYLIFTNRKIREIIGSGDSYSPSEGDYALLDLGDDSNPAFIEPATVLGMAVETVGRVLSTFQEEDFPLLKEENLFSKNLTIEPISVFGKISKIALIISGIEEKFLRRRYNIKLGGSSIMNKLSQEPKRIGDGQLLFVFENVVPVADGLLSFTIDKSEKSFGSNYSSTGYSAQATALFDSRDSFSIEDGTLTTLEEIKNILGSFSPSTNVLDALYPPPNNNGVLFNPNAVDSSSIYTPFVPIDITTSAKIELGLNGISSNTVLSPGVTESKVTELARSTLIVGAGATFANRTYILDEINGSNSGLLFFNAITEGMAAIKCNVPEIISINDIVLSSGDEVPMVVGNKYEAVVENTDRDFILKFGDTLIKPRGRPEPIDETPGRYVAIFEAPPELLDVTISQDNCFDVCASIENAERNRAKVEIGRSFVVDLEQTFEDLLLGPLKDKTPDVLDLKEKLENAPLRFTSILMDEASIVKYNMKSFCDLSYSLTAELKTSLTGFKVLMVPIQVTFCIIDVICSLLNPVKLAASIIRLFQCLYDLVLLLPQISVPVMFLQLVLHLLELLKCVIDKVLFTITAINEISKSINIAAQLPIDYAAIKALEETLSEYLFDLEADLEFLGPVVSILAIFIELLQLVFRFPCSISPGDGEPDCGVDGTMLAGIVAGIAAPDSEIIPGVMLPVGQTYSTDDLGSTESGDITEPTSGDVIAIASGGTFLDSMNLDEDSLRGTSAPSGGIDFNATMAPAFTKSTKNMGKPSQSKFRFNGRGLSTMLNSKNIDPSQTVDTPMGFLDKDGNVLSIIESGNLYSPIDGDAFLDISGDRATVKPLVLEIEVPVFASDPDTGVQIQTGTEIVTRTFDNIPKLVIMDDDFNVYFIQEEGIEFDSDGFVDTITADIVNKSSSPKFKFSKEEVEIDTDGDPSTDEGTMDIFDFPQLYFFDMRQAGEQLEQFCSTSSINSFLFEDNNTEDIEEIVEDAQECLETYISGVRAQVATVRDAQVAGTLPLPEISVTDFTALGDSVVDCLNGTVDDICKYVINGLNTSFKILEDTDNTPLVEFTNGDISEDILGDFEAIGPDFTGAREYAAGIGDSASISIGGIATVEIIPRDSYDNEIIGDFTDRINLEIISDETGSAEFIKNSDGSILTKDGTVYTAQLTAKQIGEVKIRARVCDRTIQALTFDGIESQIIDSETDVDCIPDSVSEISTGSSPLGALTKVDRLLSIFFIKTGSTSLSNVDSSKNLSAPQPQQFGSGLEN